MLPNLLVAVDERGRPLERSLPFERVDARSEEARKFSESDWDSILCANVDALADALRSAGLIRADSTLRVLGCQVDEVDILLAEVARNEGVDHEDDGKASPRRLVLLEDKLLRNPQAKREVLAQLLDYAQRAQREWTATNLASHEKLKDCADWIERHRSAIDLLLGEGDLLLVIAGDDIHDDLLRLTRRFASFANQVSLSELCLVSMPLYRRGDERLLVPHVVSAVERHQRRLAIRVTVKDAEGRPLPVRVATETEEDDVIVERSRSPRNADVETVLGRLMTRLKASRLAHGYSEQDTAKKQLLYWSQDDPAVAFTVYFGRDKPGVFTPISVGLLVQGTARPGWPERVRRTEARALPDETKLKFPGPNRVEAQKEFDWSVPADLDDRLLVNVADTLLAFEALFGTGSGSDPTPGS